MTLSEELVLGGIGGLVLGFWIWLWRRPKDRREQLSRQWRQDHISDYRREQRD